MRIFVISNNCFAKNNSNGRMMSCLFRDIKAEDVSQFYIVNGNNDFEVCSNFYLISDHDIVSSKSKRCIGRQITADSAFISKQTRSEYRGKVGRNSLTMLIRYALWRLNSRRVYENIINWLTPQKPDLILLQAGDAPFMYDLAVMVSKVNHIPLVIFNTEFFYFEKLNWVNGANKGILFYTFRWIFKNSFQNAMEEAQMSIHNSEWLKGYFESEFKTPSTFIYQSSDIHNQSYVKSNNKRLVYVGNLTFCRHLPIIEIAKELNIIDKSFIVEVYGPGSEETILKLGEEPNIKYFGVVPYEHVTNIIQDASLLLVVESLDPVNSKLTEYGFSTKITDYMGTGVPILGYGSEKNVGLDYLKKNGAAFVVNKRVDLRTTLTDAIFNDQRRIAVVEKAMEMSDINHRSENNSNKFHDILKQVLKAS